MFGACCTVNAIYLPGFKPNPIEFTLKALKQRCQVSAVKENHTPNPLSSPFFK
jgi:hypothetical protein